MKLAYSLATNAGGGGEVWPWQVWYPYKCLSWVFLLVEIIRFPIIKAWTSNIVFSGLDSYKMAFHQENSGFCLLSPTLFLLKNSGEKMTQLITKNSQIFHPLVGPSHILYLQNNWEHLNHIYLRLIFQIIFLQIYFIFII